MPTKKQSQFRLSDQHLEVLEWITAKMNLKRAAAMELAITHLAGTLADKKPIYHVLPEDGDDGPKSHKRPKRAA